MDVWPLSRPPSSSASPMIKRSAAFEDWLDDDQLAELAAPSQPLRRARLGAITFALPRSSSVTVQCALGTGQKAALSAFALVVRQWAHQIVDVPCSRNQKCLEADPTSAGMRLGVSVVIDCQ